MNTYVRQKKMSECVSAVEGSKSGKEKKGMLRVATKIGCLTLKRKGVRAFYRGTTGGARALRQESTWHFQVASRQS